MRSPPMPVRRVFKVLARASAAESETACDQVVERGLIQRAALALPQHRAVPYEAVGGKRPRSPSLRLARLRGVSMSSMRTSHSPPCARASHQLASGGDQRAEMQRSRG